MRRALLSAVLIFGFLGWLGLATAALDPVIVRYRVPIVGLERPLRLVHLSDLHASPIDMPAVRVRRIVAMANALDPDVIMLTGDFYGGKFFDPPGFEVQQVVPILEGLVAHLGIVVVLGNHDDSFLADRLFRATDMKLLRGEFVDLGPLVVAGADSIAHHFSPATGLRRAIDAAPADKPLISLSHEPETAQFILARSQLHLSGHTHGGQIIVPGLRAFGVGPLADNPFLLAHTRGLYRLGERWLLVSSGLGTSLLPLRLGVPPEIVVVELVPSS